MYISLLTDDYLKPSGRFTRNFVKESRELRQYLNIMVNIIC